MSLKNEAQMVLRFSMKLAVEKDCFLFFFVEICDSNLKIHFPG